MSAPDIDARLTEIGARAEAATPGPWYAVDYYGTFDRRTGPGGVEVVTLDSEGVATSGYLCPGGYDRSAGTMVFIAHARQDVPWLVAQLRDALARLSSVPDTTSEERAIVCGRTVEGDATDDARDTSSLPAEARTEPGPDQVF